MNAKSKLGYMLLGGMIGIFGLVVGLCVSPLTAQRDTFGDITCTGLTVVDSEDTGGCLVFARGVLLLGKDGKSKAGMSIDEHGGNVVVWGKDEKSKVFLGIDEGGGRVTVRDKDARLGVVMGFSEDGARVAVVSGKDESGAYMAISSEDAGVVGVHGKDWKTWAEMRSDENGGQIGVFGKGGVHSRATMGVNEYGNGGVSTWDKSGYRLK